MSQFLALSHLQAVKTPTKKYAYIVLNAGSCASDPWDLSPAHMIWVGFSFFERDSYCGFCYFKLVSFHQLNRQSPPIEEVEKTFCLQCHCKLCASNAACGREVGHLPPWLTVGTSLLGTTSFAPVSSLQRSASLSAATSLFPMNLCHNFRPWTVH